MHRGLRCVEMLTYTLQKLNIGPADADSFNPNSDCAVLQRIQHWRWFKTQIVLAVQNCCIVFRFLCWDALSFLCAYLHAGMHNGQIKPTAGLHVSKWQKLTLSMLRTVLLAELQRCCHQPDPEARSAELSVGKFECTDWHRHEDSTVACHVFVMPCKSADSQTSVKYCRQQASPRCTGKQTVVPCDNAVK